MLSGEEADNCDQGDRVPESIAQWLWEVHVNGYAICERTQHYAQFTDRQRAECAARTYEGRWAVQE